MSTVKPEYKDHTWHPKIVAIVDSGPCSEVVVYYKYWNVAFEMVAFQGRWSVFGGVARSGLTVLLSIESFVGLHF
jgi:hypothetical protein